MRTILYLLIPLFFITSCFERDDEIGEAQRERDRSLLIGVWAGTYTGHEDSGVIEIYILGPRGGGTVIMTSNKGFVEKFRCSASEYGQVEGASRTIPLSIRGNLHEKKGTWKRGVATGEWTIRKISNQ